MLGIERLWQLGNGANADSSVPVPVNAIGAGATTIGSGNNHTCALVSGAAKCWGNNLLGQLGNATITDSNVAVQVNGITAGASAIAGGGYSSCAAVSGIVKCWGSNSGGQLGNGTNTSSNVLVDVFGVPDGVPAYTGVDLLSTTSARVRWIDNASNESGYQVYRVLGAVQTLVPGCSTTSPGLAQCMDSGLLPGTYYQY